MTSPLRFKRVQVRRLEGIDEPFAVEDLSAGVNVVYGPNGCGKSRTAEAINTLLWPASDGSRRASLAGLADLDGREWRIDLDAGATRYQCGGADSRAPGLPPPEARDRYNLPLHELIHGASTDFAETILRESAGGYDLKLAEQALGARPGASNPRKETDALKAADRAVREAEEAQRGLLEEEQRLADLGRSLDAAQRAAERATVLRAVQNYREIRRRLVAAEAELALFPEGVGKVRGDEPQAIDRLKRELREAEAVRDRAGSEAEEWEKVRRDCRLGEEGVGDDVLKTLAERRQRLNTLRATLDAQSRQRAGAAEARDKARAALSPTASDEQLARVNVQSVGDVAAFAREAMKVDGGRYACNSLHDWVGTVVSPPDLDRLGYAQRLLLRWLATPAPQGAVGSTPGPLRLLLVVAAVLVVLQSLVLALRVHWAFAALALSPLAALLLKGRVAQPPGEGDGRRMTEAEFAKLGVAGPARWSTADVEAAADRLATELAAARLDVERAARWGDLAGRRAQLDEAARALEARRHSIAARLGLRPDAEPLSLVVLASNVAAWQDADANLERAEAEYAKALEQFNDELEAFASLLKGYGYPAPDVPALSAAVEALRERDGKFRDATRSAQSARQRASDAGRQIESARRQLNACFTELGLSPGDERTLRDWCDRRQPREQARLGVDRARVELELAEKALADDRSLREAAPDELGRDLQEAEALAATAPSIKDETVQIRTRVDGAKKAVSLEEALANRRECLARLAERREDDSRAVAAWVLAEHLRLEGRDNERPRVFHRARELFGRITQGCYRLDFDDSADPPEFRATDSASGAGLALEQLSSGTRLQLLLAVRVAFVEEHEDAVRLPLLLDEALANSDEARAGAIIDATLGIVRSGRQVFYFTAQHDEVAKWKSILESAGDVPYRLIDLAEVRGMAATERLPLPEISAPAAPKVPEPVGLSREQYAELLKVPAFDPSRPHVGGTHLWHLIEEPQVLYQFLNLGINTWGQLETLGSFSAGALLDGSAGAYRSAAAAARALAALAEAWRVGRGRRIHRQVILDSAAVTANFVERVCALLESVDGDPVRLLEGLEQGRVPRFRDEAIEKLRIYLTAEGYVDERTPLPPDQVRARMLSAVADDVRQGLFDPARVDQYLACFYAGRNGS